MEEKWLEFAALFGDAFLELLVEEHTVTITLKKNNLERIKNLLKNSSEELKNKQIKRTAPFNGC